MLQAWKETAEIISDPGECFLDASTFNFMLIANTKLRMYHVNQTTLFSYGFNVLFQLCLTQQMEACHGVLLTSTFSLQC